MDFDGRGERARIGGDAGGVGDVASAHSYKRFEEWGSFGPAGAEHKHVLSNGVDMDDVAGFSRCRKGPLKRTSTAEPVESGGDLSSL